MVHSCELVSGVVVKQFDKHGSAVRPRGCLAITLEVDLLFRSLRPCVQRRPMSDPEERCKPAQRPEQYGYIQEWLWSLAPRLAPDQSYALRVPGRTSIGVAPPANRVQRCAPRSVDDRSLGCSIGCPALKLAAASTPSSRNRIGAPPATRSSVQTVRGRAMTRAGQQTRSHPVGHSPHPLRTPRGGLIRVRAASVATPEMSSAAVCRRS
jgi:hypothetical protein